MKVGLPSLPDDGLINLTIGKWTLEKYKLVRYYADLFSSSMKGKWGSRVYVDLFSGPGRGRIKFTTRIVPASPLLAIDLPNPFDTYIFCEIEDDRIAALEYRIKRDYSGVIASYIPGDSNKNVNKILSSIPQPSSSHTVITLCFVDPYRLENIQFSTIQTLSVMRMDFLVLIPAYMDAHRNLPRYLSPKSDRIEIFLGDPDWRKKWSIAKKGGLGFGSFVANRFGEQMKSLGYKYLGLIDTVLVKDTARNRSLYRLAFFSRHDLGMKFWREAKKYTLKQLPLFPNQ